MATVKCRQCGGDNDLDSGSKFMKCRYCESQMYIDKSGAGFFYILPYQPGFATQEQVAGTFRRWTAGPRMAKGLEAGARVTAMKPQYFPVYLFKRSAGGQEQVYVQPARSTTLPGMHSLKVPAGDLKVFDQKYNHEGIELIQPDIVMGAYMQALPGTAVEQSLVYFPIWSISYEYGGRQYQVALDGSSGEIFAAEYPPRAEAPFLAISIGGFAAFLAEGLVAFFVSFPLGGALICITVPLMIAGSYYVASKM